jgi:hypothetical protein
MWFIEHLLQQPIYVGMVLFAPLPLHHMVYTAANNLCSRDAEASRFRVNPGFLIWRQKHMQLLKSGPPSH